MKYRDVIAEDGAKAINRLRRQRNFGNQNYSSLSAFIHQMLEDLDIHEGLPASGDAVQQENITRLRRSHRGNCGSLCSRWTMAIGRPGRSCREWIAIDNLCFDDNQTTLLESLQHRRRE